MRYSNHRWFRQQASFLRRQFLQDGELPFSDVLSDGSISQALTAINVCWVDRIFTPLVTLWVFLGQVLSADQSCRAAVARLIAHRLAKGQCPCSAETGAYCQARKRLPEQFFSNVARQTASVLESKVAPQWLWNGRRVLIFDGAAVSMPDTPENQCAYPQPDTQKPGLGFPLARIAAVFSLACGAVLELGICRYAGKGQSESGLLRTMWSIFRPGDVLLGDRLMCAWVELVMLKQRGVDSVCHFTSFDGASASGSVYVYSALTGSPERQINSPSPAGAFQQFGQSFASSGNQLIIGNSNHSVPMFNVDTGQLIQQFQMPAGTSSSSFFGEQVATTGNQVFIAAPQESQIGAGAGTGVVHSFDLNSGSFIRTMGGDLNDPHRLGSALAVAGNGLLAGDFDTTHGRAYLFDVNSGNVLRMFDQPAGTDNAWYGTPVTAVGNFDVIASQTFQRPARSIFTTQQANWC